MFSLLFESNQLFFYLELLSTDFANIILYNFNNPALQIELTYKGAKGKESRCFINGNI